MIEAVGSSSAFAQALGMGMVRDGGVISQIGVPKGVEHLSGYVDAFSRNITLTGGLAPTRAYVNELVPGILSGAVEPGLVFDHEVPLRDIADGYRAMDERTALKVIVTP